MRVALAERYGPPEVAAVGTRPRPEPGRGELRIRVLAASVGASDGAWRSGRPWFARLAFGLRRPRHPVMGSDLAGLVDAVGPGTTRFAVGDRVFGATGASGGAHAEFVVVGENGAIERLPEGVSWSDAAALCDGAMTALPFLRDGGHVRPGMRVLVNGAAGSVGGAAVQLARHLGAEVTGVCSTANVDHVRALGAQHVVDRTQVDAMRTGERYDVVFDAAGKSTYRRARRALVEGGVYLTTVPSWAIMVQQLTSRLGRTRAVIMFTGLRPDEVKRPDLDELAALATTGVVRPAIDRVLPIERIADAYRIVDTGHKRGSVIVTPSTEPGEES
ncbi:NAD(P)-dependent alcohol dehydrogenase [Agromyces sp. NPDC056523]|uniref:NAD(P)-dependent alcohol dehydrogenase n=1 Tax=Agromyces sp. NPDC056523 TaxID=3345850 RepID=UPI0036722A4E